MPTSPSTSAAIYEATEIDSIPNAEKVLAPEVPFVETCCAVLFRLSTAVLGCAVVDAASSVCVHHAGGFVRAQDIGCRD